MNKIKTVGIVGMGAMGAAYAKAIGRNTDYKVYGIVKNVMDYGKHPVVLNDETMDVEYVSIKSRKKTVCDLIIITVKAYDLNSVINDMKGFVGDNTIILSFLNGLTSEEQLIRKYGENKVLYSTIMGADTRRDARKVVTKCLGCVYFGERHNKTLSDRVLKVKELWESCNIPYVIPEDMISLLWDKFMINIGCNMTTTAYGATYGQLRENPKCMEVMRNAQREVIELANANNVTLTEEAIIKWEEVLGKLSPDGMSSMYQDFCFGRKLEIEILGETAITLGEEYNIPVPAIKSLYDKINQKVRERDFKSYEVYSTPDKIANKLRMDILKNKYNNGEKISENQLAEQFSASRSSVREAVQYLVSEGLLIEHKNGRKTVVGFTYKQLEDLYKFRCLIELESLKIMLQNKNTVYPLISKALQRIEAAHNSGNELVNWYDLDIQFHSSIIRSSENIYFIRAWDQIEQLIYTIMTFNATRGYYKEYSETFFAKHKKLYEMFITRDPASEEALRIHILDAKAVSYEVYESIH